MDARRRDPEARFVVASGDRVLLEGEQDVRLMRLTADRVPRAQSAEPPLLLGLEDGRPLLAADLDAGAEPPVVGSRWAGLREAGAILSHSEGGLAASLVGLLNWHRSHRFCAACGAPSLPDQGGYARRCTRCGTMHFPRTDPAVIMLVHDGERLLLGRRAAWPERRYSVLAGFVAPGESLEEAVVREVREESGILVRDPRFVASQPWPFPSSLMLGFTAAAAAPAGEPVARDGELADVRWFEPEAVLDALARDGGELALPPPISIARLLIDRWAAGLSPARPARA